MINVGIIVTDLYDYYQQTFLNGFKSFCKDKNIKMFVFVGDSLGSNSDEDSFFSIIYNSSVDVILMLSVPLASLCGFTALQGFIDCLPDIPIISVGLDIPGIESIIIDNKMGVSKLMDHLVVNHNLKKIAFIKGPDTNKEASDRFDAYRESLSRHNIPFNYKLVAPGNFSSGDGRKGLSLILDIRKEKIDAVFCCHDLAAFEVIRNLNSRGINVPGDIPVVGFDNLDISSSFSPSLTTVRQPVFNIGVMAGRYVENISLNISNPDSVLVDTHVILRESCGCSRSIIFYNNNGAPKIKSGFKELIKGAQDQIINKSRFNNDIGDSNKILIDAVERISDSIIYCDENQSSEKLIVTIESILKDTMDMQFDASFWKYVLEEYYITISSGSFTRERQLYVSSLLNSALIMLYETEKKIQDFKNVDNRSIIQYTNYIGDMLLTCKNDKELKQILKNHLSTLTIKNCFIVLFTDDKGIGELYFTRNMERLFDDDVYRFDMSTLLPRNIGNAWDLSYIVCSLRVDNKELGYILIENGDTPNIMYNFVSEKVSYGFKNISLIEKMNSYTRELEEAVEGRTKELKLANSKLQERSMRDQLTGLYNRRFLEEIVIPSSNSSLFGIILVDLDHFKMVNDLYGHSSGDTVIQELAKIFRYLVRPEDYVIRLGGEEFLLVLRDFQADFLVSIVEKVRKTVKKSRFIMGNGDEINKTCSLGAMVYPPSLPALIDFKSAISIIDKCLYRSKNRGRDRGHVIDICSDQFSGCENAGLYITNNFEKCITTNKIKLIECN